MLDTTTSTPRSDLIRVHPVTFPAGDANLGGTLFLPASAPRAALVLNGATGVPQGYYRHFARWLAADRGIACLTYDYRGVGQSATGHVRHSTATMADWALGDQPAARAEMRRRLPGVPLWVMGHSLGAMTLPAQDGIEEVARVIGVCAGHVHFRDHPWPYQALARLFWFGHAPLVTRALGYLPGRRLGFGEDLPEGVYWTWRRWCTDPDALYRETGLGSDALAWSRGDAHVRLIALADDDVAPPDAVWRLARAYGDRRVTRVLIDPARHGLANVGHLAAFSRSRARLWPVLLGEDADGPDAAKDTAMDGDK